MGAKEKFYIYAKHFLLHLGLIKGNCIKEHTKSYVQ